MLDLGILLEGVTVFSCIYAYFQEGKADSAMEAFKNMVPRYATGIFFALVLTIYVVVRDGASISIPSCDLVPGDVIHVKLGTQVPADSRLLWHQGIILFDIFLKFKI